jgi:hypothetical protein
VKPLLKNIFLHKYSLLVLAIALFTFSFIFNKLYTNRSSVAQEVRTAQNYINDQQGDFSRFLNDSSLINRLLTRNETQAEFTHLASKRYGIFLYTVNIFGSTEMKFWSDQLVVPPPEMFTATDGEYFLQLSNGWYYIIKKTLNDNSPEGTVLSYAMIPVRSKFFIETEYLPEQFTYSNIADRRVQISKMVTDFPVKTASGKILFYLEKKISGAVPYNNRLTIFLRLGALLLLFLFLQLLAEDAANRSGAWKAIGLLAILLLAVRLLMYYFPFVLNLRQFELFDPAIYGSSAVQRSLGDLLINVIFFCWIVLFAWPKLRHNENLTADFPKWVKWFAGIFSLCLLIFSTFVLATVIRSLVSDSKISFDVTNFFSLSRYTVAGVVALACLS